MGSIPFSAYSTYLLRGLDDGEGDRAKEKYEISLKSCQEKPEWYIKKEDLPISE